MMSCTLILPAEFQRDGNLVSVALGHDEMPGSTYVVALSSNGDEPATHYGCHAWVTDAFVAAINAANGGVLPRAPWAAVGLTESAVNDVIGALIMTTRDSSASEGHFDATIAENGLQRVSPKYR